MNKKVFLLILSLGVLLTGWLLAQNTVITSGNLTVSGIGQENNSFVLYSDGHATFANGTITLGTDGGLTGGFYFAGDHISVTGDGVPFKIRGFIDDSLNLQEWYSGSDTNLIAKLDAVGKFTAQQFEGNASLLSGTRVPIYDEPGTVVRLNTGGGGETILHNSNGDASLIVGNTSMALTNGFNSLIPAGLTLNDNGTVTLFGGVYGDGLGLTNLNASNLSSGTVAAARIAALNYQSPFAWLTNIGGTGAITNAAAGAGISLGVSAGVLTITNTQSAGYVAGDSPTFNVVNTTNWFTNTLTTVPGFRFWAAKSAQDFMQWGTNGGTMMGNISSNGVLNLSNSIYSAGGMTNVGAASLGGGNLLIATGSGNLSSSGSFGIGTNSPQQKLDVLANVVGPVAKLQNNSASGWTAFDIYNSSGVSAGGFGYGNASVGNFPNQIYLFGTGSGGIVLANGGVGSGNVRLKVGASGSSEGINLYTNAYLNAILFATNGVSSLRSNLVAPSAITVGSSPFSFTNTQAYNVYVFITGSGVTGTVNLNGTQIFGGIGGGSTVPLQPNEYVTAVYSLGTPTMTWKPF